MRKCDRWPTILTMTTMPLWKQCRILANPLRLEILACLGRNEPQCVKGIAEETGVSMDVSSKNLQLLESGGFLIRDRKGKYMFYSLNRSDALQKLVLGDLRTGRLETKGIIHTLTAMTHDRRIAIVATLANEPLEFGVLCQQTRISRLAMERHIDKLARRGFVSVDEGICRLLKQGNRISAHLINLATESVTLAQV